MKSLNEVLADKKEIISLVKLFGFLEDVKIISEPIKKGGLITLTLLVSTIPETQLPWENSVRLSAKLSKELACQVDVVVLENISRIHRFGFLEKSASLSDEKKICALFGVISTDAILLDDTEKPDPIVLKHAEEYLNSLMGREKKLTDAENLSKHAVVCAAEGDVKKRKVGSSDEADSPNQGSTESPQKNNGPGSAKK
jgi:hypothetical protein